MNRSGGINNRRAEMKHLKAVLKTAVAYRTRDHIINQAFRQTNKLNVWS
jgi:hypothetical protein